MLVVVEFKRLKLVQIGRWTVLKLVWLPKGILKYIVVIIMIPFFPVAKIPSVCHPLSMAAMCSWPLYQLDIKNAFLHGDLA